MLSVFQLILNSFFVYTESVMELLFNVINIIPDPFVGIMKENILDMIEFSEVLSRMQDIIGYKLTTL